MLIKKQKLAQIRNTTGLSIVDLTETSRASQLEIQKAKQEARVIKQEAQKTLEDSQKKLKDAETKAREIIQNANQEAGKIKEKVYRDTLQRATEEAEALKSKAKGLLKELFDVKREALDQAHKDIIKVALDLAEKIIKYQASIDPNVLRTQVVEAIKKATSEADRVQVYVNPNDLKVLEESIPELQKLFPIGIDIVPLTNESVDPGSCVVETKSGQLDARFSTQLTALTSLTSHLEVIEPEIEIDKEVEAIHRLSKEKTFIEPEEILKEDEIGEPEEELLGDEPLINIPKVEEVFPFTSEEDKEVQEIEKVQEQEEESEKESIVEVPPEIAGKMVKKKLSVSDFPERTQEEIEELDEGFNEEVEPKYEEDLEEEEKPVDLKNILKPKKKGPTQDVSKIAKEIEENPEWKDLIQEEEEE